MARMFPHQQRVERTLWSTQIDSAEVAVFGDSLEELLTHSLVFVVPYSKKVFNLVSSMFTEVTFSHVDTNGGDGDVFRHPCLCAWPVIYRLVVGCVMRHRGFFFAFFRSATLFIISLASFIANLTTKQARSAQPQIMDMSTATE